MKSFKILFATVICVMAGVFILVNTSFMDLSQANARPYKVEANRIEQQILNGESYSLSDYQYITEVTKLENDNTAEFYNPNSDYLVREINGTLYRFDYKAVADNSNTILYVNLSLATICVAVIIVLIYIYFAIIRPFDKLYELPGELAKGNLTIPLKENKHTYFGRFIWGMDNLREHLENRKLSELQLQKEKKTLVLSLSHDIKTPLSVIELYAKALYKGLYKDEQKNREVSLAISEKCSEIKNYVDEIIKTSNEDFLNLEVNNTGFYLIELVKEIKSFYTDKLSLLNIDFTVENNPDLLLKGDLERSVEVLQNIIENAIKYGDGRYIGLSFCQDEGVCLVTVKNSGDAISDNDFNHMFDSFYRGSNVNTQSGSGLGLYICRQLMIKMGGEIYAESAENEMSITAVFSME